MNSSKKQITDISDLDYLYTEANESLKEGADKRGKLYLEQKMYQDDLLKMNKNYQTE